MNKINDCKLQQQYTISPKFLLFLQCIILVRFINIIQIQISTINTNIYPTICRLQEDLLISLFSNFT